MKNKVLIIFILLLLFTGTQTFSFDIWQNPEMAENYSIFAGCFPASFAFSYTSLGDFRFDLSSPKIFLDVMLPLALPFSLGASIQPLTHGTFGIGARPGYHINFNDPNIDVYFLYSLYLEFIEDTSAYLEWTPAIGIRRRFGFFCINLETGFMAKSLLIGFSLKLN
jgi:hypothetical protein